MIWCVVVVMVAAAVVIVYGLDVLLVFLNFMRLRFGSVAENVFSSSSIDESFSRMFFSRSVVIGISDVVG